MTEVSSGEQVLVTTHPDGTSEVSVGGTVQVLSGVGSEDVHLVVTTLVAERAAQLGRPVRVLHREPDGERRLVVTPSGQVHDDAPSSEPDPGPAAEPVWQSFTPPPAEPLVTPPVEPPAPVIDLTTPAERRTPAVAAPWSDPEALARPVRPWAYDYPEGRRSFLREEAAEVPARRGWRGWLNQAGLRLAPVDAERAERLDELTVSQHWPGPRTIAVVNGKGGAGKTPTTALLAAVFARYGGAGVLAWDNNQTRGTLGWRTEQAGHDGTVVDLIPRVPHLLGETARSSDLAQYVHHQRADRYDVLRSKPLALASEQRVAPEDVDDLHTVASKYYRLVIIDSGNDESDPMWLRMIDHTDQVVVATSTRDDHAEAGALLLEALASRDERCAALASSAVVVVSQAVASATQSDVRRIAEGFSGLAREVASIPFDRAMVEGQLRHEALAADTRRAWLRAAAAVARGL
ncbi:AAA family ATPase [Quadrisphaera sp. INWT6]|uniref:AAA family ATPase n=1 Tax=Quadrisphaera sp. INWT6 TaxID=2596917 RepID=UPI00189268F3|nr:AAA family ATPase [Quadrisphaera sp. INWT6]MBF5082331.1 AAA family ATPase [Quadrisphaera sp. INWT6]